MSHAHGCAAVRPLVPSVRVPLSLVRPIMAGALDGFPSIDSVPSQGEHPTMRISRWFAFSSSRGATAVLLVLIGACHSSRSSRDGALSDSAPTAIESGHIDVDAPLSIADATADSPQGATETGATDAEVSSLPLDVGQKPDAAIDTMEVGTDPDAASDSRDAGLTTLDLNSGSEASVPSGCVGEDLFVDVTDQRSPSASKRLLHPCARTLPMAYPVMMGGTLEVAICASENPDSSGATFGLRFIPTGQDAGYFSFDGVSWNTLGGSTPATNRCGGPAGGTITRFDSGGGILEGTFENIAVGYSCERVETTVSGHFRVCYVPAS
jgi:hypothetical protein